MGLHILMDQLCEKTFDVELNHTHVNPINTSYNFFDVPNLCATVLCLWISKTYNLQLKLDF